MCRTAKHYQSVCDLTHCQGPHHQIGEEVHVLDVLNCIVLWSGFKVGISFNKILYNYFKKKKRLQSLTDYPLTQRSHCTIPGGTKYYFRGYCSPGGYCSPAIVSGGYFNPLLQILWTADQTRSIRRDRGINLKRDRRAKGVAGRGRVGPAEVTSQSAGSSAGNDISRKYFARGYKDIKRLPEKTPYKTGGVSLTSRLRLRNSNLVSSWFGADVSFNTIRFTASVMRLELATSGDSPGYTSCGNMLC